MNIVGKFVSVAALAAAGVGAMAGTANAATLPVPHSVTVAPGDTLWHYSQEYGISLDTLINNNHLSNPNLIFPGQNIILTGPAAPAPVVTPSVPARVAVAPQAVHSPVVTPDPAPPAVHAAAAPVQAAVHSAPALGGTFACIRQHESTDNYSIDTGNGYYGAYQFAPSTWNTAVAGAGYGSYANGRADLAPASVQDAAASWLQAHAGWGQWSTASLCGV